MFERIRLWWKFEGRYYHKDFIQGVKNLWKWFPTIWKDRDWDGDFIYEILKVKLENQAYYIASKDRHIEAKRDAEKILLCTRLIQLQQDDLYRMEYLDYLKEEHEFIPTDETEKWYTIKDTLIEDNLDEYFEKYPRQYERVITGEINHYKYPPGEKDRKMIAVEIGLENQERSRKLLFKILEQHIEEWWD